MRDNGGHAVAMAWSMANIYNVEPGEVFWAASDVGWVVGHSYIVYAPLLAGCTTILYEGKPVGTPDAGAFWRVIEEHKVSVLFTAPTAFRAIKRDDPNAEHLKRYDLGDFRALFLAGERCDPDTLQLGRADRSASRSIDHWWQTETGWAIAANCLGIEQLPVKPGSPTRAVPGYDVQVLDDSGEPVQPGDIGRIMIKLPLPPGCLPTLWGNDARFVQSYLATQPGYYLTGDAGYIDEDGYVFVMSRIDDIINVAGHRLSTGAMEEVLASHPDVAECAVIGVADQLKGELPLGLVVLKSGVNRDKDRHQQGTGESGARPDRPGRRLQDGRRRRATAQDTLRQDPARHHEVHRRRQGLPPARHHRRPGHPRRDPGRAGRHRLRQARLSQAGQSRGLERQGAGDARLVPTRWPASVLASARNSEQSIGDDSASTPGSAGCSWRRSASARARSAGSVC